MIRQAPTLKIVLALLTVIIALGSAASIKAYPPFVTFPASAPDSGIEPVAATASQAAPKDTPEPAAAPGKAVPYLQILIYHEIGAGPNGLYVAVQNFEEQMKYLYDNGYTGITLAEGRALLEGRGNAPAGQPVVLTFDDAYRSFIDHAYPVLSKYGFKATVFVIADYTGDPNYLSWEQIADIASHGMEIGSHSRTHTLLPTLESTRLNEEIAGSKAVLEQHLGQPVSSFCYPCGEYDQTVIDAVRQAGYQQAVTVKYGWATTQSPALEIPRIRISRYLTHDKFAEMFPPQSRPSSAQQ